MKQNNLFALGMMAVLLVFGLVLAGCDTGSDEQYNGPKSFKVTGINKADITATAEVNIISNDDTAPANGQVARGHGEIVSQVLSVDLYNSTTISGKAGKSTTLRMR